MATTTYGSPYAQSADLVSAWPATSLSVADRIDDVSFKGNGVNDQTASATGVLLDAGKTVVMNVATANTFTIPTAATVAYENGTMIRISNKGAGTTTIQPSATVTLNGGNVTLLQYQSATIQLVAANVWNVVATPAPAATASGLTFITVSSFSAVSSVSLNNCFSTTYENYAIQYVSTSASANSNISMRLRVGGVDASGASDYIRQAMVGYSTSIALATATGSSWGIGGMTTGSYQFASKMEIFNPFLATRTNMTSRFDGFEGAGSVWQSGADGFNHILSTSYDGFTVLASTGTITGKIFVYGYQKA